MNFLFNTEELAFGMFSKGCTTAAFGGYSVCDVPSPYDSSKDSDYVAGAQVSGEEVYFDQGLSIDRVDKILVTGNEFVTKINMTVPKYLRSYNYNGFAFEIV